MKEFNWPVERIKLYNGRENRKKQASFSTPRNMSN